MRFSLAQSVLSELLADGTISRSDTVLAVCAGEREHELFSNNRFEHVVLSNISEQQRTNSSPSCSWSYQNAESLSYEDGSFDLTFVADGLHHCTSPHRAMLEMYRVARKGIIVIESRRSLLMQVANRLGLSPEYEVEAVVGSELESGGVNNTAIPNHIYRWTEGELMRTIRSYDPIGRHHFRFFYELNLPYELADWKKSKFRLNAVRIVDPFAQVLTRVFKKQCNTLAMVVLKPVIPRDLWPWLRLQGGEVVFNPAYADRHFEPIDAIVRRYSSHEQDDRAVSGCQQQRERSGE
jgi:ubiquinone/menaquinone biosynthesis C-methylase UbiE